MEKYHLEAELLRKKCDCSVFTFESTADIPPLEGIIGQERGVRALEFGLKVNKPGYNIFIAGVTGTGRSSYTRSLVNDVAAVKDRPLDWCYLYNFANPDEPLAISFTPGKAVEFKADVEDLLEKVTAEIPLALESDECQKAKTLLLQKLQVKQNEAQAAISNQAKELGFALKTANKALVTIPLNEEGKPMDEKEFQDLYEAKRK